MYLLKNTAGEVLLQKLQILIFKFQESEVKRIGLLLFKNLRVLILFINSELKNYSS